VRMVKVKICGLTRENDVAGAVEAGADAVGFISGFPESPRNVTLSRAAELMRGVPHFVDRVLVTTTLVVDKHQNEIREMRADALQLYGMDPDVRGLRVSLGLRLIRPHLLADGSDAIEDVSGFDALLSDTFVRGRLGGTGKVSDWNAARELRDRVAPMPFILSGGLNLTNVGEAIVRVRPFAVDASSGLESLPGVKDSAKVRAFIELANGVGVGT
jgi:phosphoribosylanthranilate isomerase